MSRKSPRKYLTGPADWWQAFEEAAATEGVSLSAWAGECMRANLPEKVSKQLSTRRGVGQPAKKPPPPEKG